MITRKRKKEIYEELIEKLQRGQGLYLIDFTGLSVQDAQELRRNFKKEGVEYKVAKNTLFKIAMKEAGIESIPEEIFFGPTGIAFGYNDPVSPSKVLKEFIDKHDDKPRFKGAAIEGQFYDETKLEKITKLPTREDMIAGIIGSLHAPVTGIARSLGSPTEGIVRSLEAVTRDLASVIEQVAKKQNAA